MRQIITFFEDVFFQSRSIFYFLLLPIVCECQVEILEPLHGKHAIGFSQVQKIVLVKGRGNVPCTVDLWYPVTATHGDRYTYRDYILLHSEDSAQLALNSIRQTVQNFFGLASDSAWDALLSRSTFARKTATLPKTKLPLILGMLRPFSTTNTCELLASHGYVIAMISQVEDFAPDDSSNWNRQMRTELELYDGVIDQLAADGVIDKSKVGLFGFSGSGFSQAFYAMQSRRPKCIALFESGLFEKYLFDAVKNSGLYRPEKLKIPFLYFYNAYNDAKAQYRFEFDKIAGLGKIKLLYADSTMHHWDFASEGFLSSVYLGNRQPDVAARQIKNYLNVNARVIDFFNKYLKGRRSDLTKQFLAGTIVKQYRSVTPTSR